MKVKDLIKQLLPSTIVNFLRYIIHPSLIVESYFIRRQPNLHKVAIEKLRGKKQVNVVFFAIYKSIWKYDTLYHLLNDDERFNPIILVCPVVNRGHEHMITSLQDCYDFFIKKKYNVVCAYNQDLDQYIDARSLKPDIIFYTNPYKGLIDDRYYITRFRDIVTYYAPYGYAISNAPEMLFDQLLHNLVYVNFYETDIHKRMAVRYARNKGRNIEVVGSLLSDEIYTRNKFCRKDGKKVIIWAPHHTIEHNGFSCFCIYHNLILELMNIYKDDVYWVFKPHPLLKTKLYHYEGWEHEKTDAYYNLWRETQYGEINEGDYTQLFVNSDAMIFDSISFMAEYYFTNNPSLFTVRSDKICQNFNDFGMNVFKLLYHAKNGDEIIWFINSVLRGEDYLKGDRDCFFKQTLYYPNASVSVYEYMLNKLL